MSERDNAGIGRQYFKTWNKRDFDTLSSLFTQDAEVVDVPAGMTQRGPAGARQEAERWADPFPDGKVEVINTIAGSTGVLVEGILRERTQPRSRVAPLSQAAPGSGARPRVLRRGRRRREHAVLLRLRTTRAEAEPVRDGRGD